MRAFGIPTRPHSRAQTGQRVKFIFIIPIFLWSCNMMAYAHCFSENFKKKNEYSGCNMLYLLRPICINDNKFDEMILLNRFVLYVLVIIAQKSCIVGEKIKIRSRSVAPLLCRYIDSFIMFKLSTKSFPQLFVVFFFFSFCFNFICYRSG